MPGPDDPLWDACPWLDFLRDVPKDASWPRLMTWPHPRAVGTYGPEVEAQFRKRRGREPRWWQRLSWARILEHDDAGLLVWLQWLMSTARQQGKSWSLQDLALWRIDPAQARRFGSDQLVLHTGKDLPILREVIEPVMQWAERAGDWHTDRRNGEWGLEHGEDDGDGRWLRGRWITRSWRQVYGYSTSLGLVDEAWRVPPRAVDDGLLPTMAEQPSPQLGLISTAHPAATGTFLDRRALAVAQLAEPVELLLLEWSAPRNAPLEDQRGWRMASPHWTDQRRRLIAGALAKAQAGTADPEDPDPVGSFRCQWLNQWPQDVDAAPMDPDMVLATEEQWRAATDPGAGPEPGALLALAVEDDLGRGAAAAAAALTSDGRIVVGGYTFATLADAVDWCEDTAEGAADPLLLAGAGLLSPQLHPDLDGLDLVTEPTGAAETQKALPELRALIRAGRLAHDGGADVSAAVLNARVPSNVNASGMLVRSTDGSTALVRCVAWAVQRAHRDRW